MKQDDTYLLKMIVLIVGGVALYQFYISLSGPEAVLTLVGVAALLSIALGVFWEYFSASGRERRRSLKFLRELPKELTRASPDSVLMGIDTDLRARIYLPDKIRARHVHIVGATGSGKTESVIVNFLKQDVARGLGSIILDAKGDASFLQILKDVVSKDKLKVFDLSSGESLTYNPMEVGLPLEAAQRLFTSLTWSEEYYKSKAFAALQHLFQYHFDRNDRNPTFLELSQYLRDPKTYAGLFQANVYPEKLAEKDFFELSGLRDQLRVLNTGHLAKILSPQGLSQMDFGQVESGGVLYFRLQSLLSRQLVSTLGKLLINHLNFLAGTAHRAEGAAATRGRLIPTYLDEFASFVCDEFTDLISKARSAGYALHFSHQSTGDLADISEGFLDQITDNSGTKIILRVASPDSAEFFARSFGTKLFQKITQRITNVKEIDRAEVVGEGTQREAHQFRAGPDLFKTLPTGVGSVLIAHGTDTPHGASTVFKIKFPKLEEVQK